MIGLGHSFSSVFALFASLRWMIVFVSGYVGSGFHERPETAHVRNFLDVPTPSISFAALTEYRRGQIVSLGIHIVARERIGRSVPRTAVVWCLPHSAVFPRSGFFSAPAIWALTSCMTGEISETNFFKASPRGYCLRRTRGMRNGCTCGQFQPTAKALR